jgi:ubiquinone/menaquinone biosynthesis C-methylase UbiE
MKAGVALRAMRKLLDGGETGHMDDKNDKVVRSFFDRQSAHYSNFFSTGTQTGAAVLFQARLALCVEVLAGRSGAFIDCASGTGEISRAVAFAYPWKHVFLNDLSPLMIDRCREVISNVPSGMLVSWNVGSVFDLNKTLNGSRFDVALCLGLIAHCGRLPELLHEIRELLKEDGVLVLQSSLVDHPGVFITNLAARSFFLGRDYRVECFRLKTILAEAGRAGLELIAVRRFGVCLPFGDRIFGRVNYRLERKFALRLNRSGGEALIILRKR